MCLYLLAFNKESGTTLGISHRENLMKRIIYTEGRRAEKPHREQ
jgi:hypothetical protein